jgi:glycine/D-amino acid oxidase-like deaminating enzyme
MKKIAVIGAGIVGVQVARALVLRGIDVTLIDRGDPGSGTSFGNAGFIATDHIFPLAHGRVLRSLPRMLLNPLSPLSMRWRELPRLLPWFLRYARACSSSRANDSIAALALIQSQAKAAWRRVLVRDGIGELFRESGSWTLFESERAFAASAQERSLQKDHQIEWEAFSAEALRERIPEIGPSVRHGVFYPNSMNTISPIMVTTALFDRFINDGGNFVKDSVSALRQQHGNIATLVTSAGEQTFDAIVVCAGHLSGRLLKPLGLKVPIVAERGYHLEVSHSELSFDMPLSSHERGFTMTPMTSGLRLAGTSEISSADHDEAPNWTRAEILKRHVADILPGKAENETARWIGHRPTLYDF